MALLLIFIDLFLDLSSNYGMTHKNWFKSLSLVIHAMAWGCALTYLWRIAFWFRIHWNESQRSSGVLLGSHCFPHLFIIEIRDLLATNFLYQVHSRLRQVWFDWYMHRMLEMLQKMDIIAAYLPVVMTSPCWPQSTWRFHYFIAKFPSTS